MRVRRVLHPSTWHTITGLPLLAVALCSGSQGGTGQAAGTGSVHVLPGEVHAVPGASFTLRARVLTNDGAISPDGEVNVAWSAGPGLTLAPSAGPEATFTAGAGGETYVRVQAGARRDSIRVLVVTGNESNADRVKVHHVPGALTSLVLSTGVINGSSVRDTLLGVVGVGLLPTLTCDSPVDLDCGVTIFSPLSSVTRRAVVWTPGVDEVSLTSHVGARRVPMDSIYVRIGHTGKPRETIEAAIRDDVKLAGLALRNNWTGLSLDTALSWSDHGAAVTLGATVACAGEEGGPPGVYEQLRDAHVPQHAFGPARVTVVYVSELYKPSKSAGELVQTGSHSYRRAPSGTSGIFCSWDEKYGTIILISWKHRTVSTTLGHEFGHALANLGHLTGTEAEFYKGSNLMVEMKAAIGNLRTYFSLGQAFRMTLSSEAVLTRTGGPSWDCANTQTSAKCPPLSLDIIRR